MPSAKIAGNPGKKKGKSKGKSKKKKKGGIPLPKAFTKEIKVTPITLAGVAATAGAATWAAGMFLGNVKEEKNKALMNDVVSGAMVVGGPLLTAFVPVVGLGVTLAGLFAAGRRLLGVADKEGNFSAKVEAKRSADFVGRAAITPLAGLGDPITEFPVGTFVNKATGEEFRSTGDRVVALDGLGAELTLGEMADESSSRLSGAFTFGEMAESQGSNLSGLSGSDNAWRASLSRKRQRAA